MTTASERGWGPGWPNCQTGRLVVVDSAGIGWRVRQEITDLTAALIRAWVHDVEALHSDQCGSFACRPIRGSTTVPSNHSWGLALDLNSLRHPQHATGTFTAAQVRAIRAILARPHFRHWRWGADFPPDRVDEMHVEYVGTVADAAADTYLLHHPAVAPADLEDDAMPLIVKDPNSSRQYVIPASLAFRVHIVSGDDLAALLASKQYVRVAMSAKQLAAIPDAA